MTPREVLLAAADLLERDGWTQGPNSGLGAHCATTAMRDTMCWGNWMGSLGTEVRALLRHHIGWHSIADWNDAPGRTRDEVVRALREAAR